MVSGNGVVGLSCGLVRQCKGSQWFSKYPRTDFRHV